MNQGRSFSFYTELVASQIDLQGFRWERRVEVSGIINKLFRMRLKSCCLKALANQTRHEVEGEPRASSPMSQVPRCSPKIGTESFVFLYSSRRSKSWGCVCLSGPTNRRALISNQHHPWIVMHILCSLSFWIIEPNHAKGVSCPDCPGRRVFPDSRPVYEAFS